MPTQNFSAKQLSRGDYQPISVLIVFTIIFNYISRNKKIYISFNLKVE